MRIIKNETNLGVAASLNRMDSEESYDYIFRFDSDDVSMPKRIQTQLDYMECNPDIDVAGTGILIFNES